MMIKTWHSRHFPISKSVLPPANRGKWLITIRITQPQHVAHLQIFRNTLISANFDVMLHNILPLVCHTKITYRYKLPKYNFVILCSISITIPQSTHGTHSAIASTIIRMSRWNEPLLLKSSVFPICPALTKIHLLCMYMQDRLAVAPLIDLGHTNLYTCICFLFSMLWKTVSTFIHKPHCLSCKFLLLYNYFWIADILTYK